MVLLFIFYCICFCPLFLNCRYYLTKADTVTNPKELMKLMVQITQNIKENINNQHGLEIPAIWLPQPHQPHQSSLQNSSTSSNAHLTDDVNQINDVCDVIEKAIHQKVQDNLSQVEQDCQDVVTHTKALLAKNELEIAAKRSREIVAAFFCVSAWMIPMVAFLTLVVRVAWFALTLLLFFLPLTFCMDAMQNITTQAECQEHLPSAVRDAEYVMATVNVLYSGFQPLLFPDGSKPGISCFTE